MDSVEAGRQSAAGVTAEKLPGRSPIRFPAKRKYARV